MHNWGLKWDPHLSIFGVPKNTKKSIRALFLGVSLLGTCFVKKTKKGGSRKGLKISPKKRSKWVPNKGGFF